MLLYIIFTKTNIVISKRFYDSWREVQHDYTDYLASLGPWPHEDVTDYLSSEYSDLSPSADEQISSLINSLAEALIVTFQNDGNNNG